jgi:sulfur carrier protein
MEIFVNGKPRAVKDTAPQMASFLQAYEKIQPTEKGVAVALNGQVVPRAQWESTTLKDGDVIEVVRAFQGG